MEEGKSTLTISTGFAKKYEEKKKREELGELRQKFGDDYEESSSSEEEDELGEGRIMC